MKVYSIINKVEDGAITSITYEAKQDEKIVSRYLVEFPFPGDSGVMRFSEHFTEQSELIEQSFESIKSTLVQHGVTKLDVIGNENKILTYLI